uniref:Uncharacterized protein n=1 Tax=Opuntia streptacantha TaxID=393608 RepID=A0A7C9EIC6_OPUST
MLLKFLHVSWFLVLYQQKHLEIVSLFVFQFLFPLLQCPKKKLHYEQGQDRIQHKVVYSRRHAQQYYPDGMKMKLSKLVHRQFQCHLCQEVPLLLPCLLHFQTSQS